MEVEELEDAPLDDVIEKIFTTPGHAGSFSSAAQIRRVLKKVYGRDAGLARVQNVLQRFRSYNMHRQSRKAFPRNPIVAHYIDQQWQADLMFLPDLAPFNDGVRTLLVCVDVVSRHAWVEPMRNKTGPETAAAFERVLSRAGGRIPHKLQTDDGLEFFNTAFSATMKKHSINHFSVHSDKKAAIAERLIKTLKERIYRFLDHDPTRNRYVDILQDLVESYNRTYHSSIKMAPAEVTAETEAEALQNLYGAMRPEADRGRLRVGDTVRIAGGNAPFMKGYKGRWTEELFRIQAIKKTAARPLFKLVDLSGEEVRGSFYEDELQKVDEPEDWQVEAIRKSRWVRRRGSARVRQHLVKWFGYPESMNSWVDASSMKQTGSKHGQ